MPYYILYNKSTGYVTRSATAAQAGDILLDSDSSIAETPELCVFDQCYCFKEGKLIPIGKMPAWNAYWDGGGWVIPPVSFAEADNDARSKRSQLLSATDWTDTLSAKERLGDVLYARWQTYRQHLRDITDQAGYPFDIHWESPPD